MHETNTQGLSSTRTRCNSSILSSGRLLAVATVVLCSLWALWMDVKSVRMDRETMNEGEQTVLKKLSEELPPPVIFRDQEGGDENQGHENGHDDEDGNDDDDDGDKGGDGDNGENTQKDQGNNDSNDEDQHKDGDPNANQETDNGGHASKSENQHEDGDNPDQQNEKNGDGGENTQEGPGDEAPNNEDQHEDGDNADQQNEGDGGENTQEGQGNDASNGENQHKDSDNPDQQNENNGNGGENKQEGQDNDASNTEDQHVEGDNADPENGENDNDENTQQESNDEATVKSQMSAKLSCGAYWLSDEQRRVAIVEMNNDAKTPKTPFLQYFSHDRLVMGSIRYALETLEWSVDVMNAHDFSSKSPNEIVAQYYRIFLLTMNATAVLTTEELQSRKDVLCRIRPLWFWGNWKGTQGKVDKNNLQEEFFHHHWEWDPKQVLAAYSESYNTFVGFHVWSHRHELTNDDNNDDDDNNVPSMEREKVGLILALGQDCLGGHVPQQAMEALVKDGFILHVLCGDEGSCNNNNNNDGDQQNKMKMEESSSITFHVGSFVSMQQTDTNSDNETAIWQQLVTLLRQAAFVVDFCGLEGESRIADVNPATSTMATPLAMEALANGAAFVNILVVPSVLSSSSSQRDDKDKKAAAEIVESLTRRDKPFGKVPFQSNGGPPSQLWTKHDPIAMTGVPYVYTIPWEAEAVALAARRSVRYRFRSYIPWQFRPRAMVARMCHGILDDDALCQCPHPIFHYHGKQQEQEAEQMRNKTPGEEVYPYDCIASSYANML